LLVAALTTPGVAVTAFVRTPSKLAELLPEKERSLLSNVNVIEGDLGDRAALERVFKEVEPDVVVMAAGRPDGVNGGPSTLVTYITSVVEISLKMPRPPRLLALGGMGAMDLPSGQRLYTAPNFPAFAKPYTEKSHVPNWQMLRATPAEFNWTFFTPSVMVEGWAVTPIATAFETAPPVAFEQTKVPPSTSLPSLISLWVPYASAAAAIMAVAGGVPTVLGHPNASYTHKRVGFYLV